MAGDREDLPPRPKNLLLIPENHTRNSFYLTTVNQLVRIFSSAGLNVRLGSLDPAITEPTEFQLPDGSSLTYEPLVRTPRRLGLKDFDPCTVLLNNDLSAGLPKILENLNEQYLLPPLRTGLGGAPQDQPLPTATRKWPISSPSCWAWIPGC